MYNEVPGFRISFVMIPLGITWLGSVGHSILAFCFGSYVYASEQRPRIVRWQGLTLYRIYLYQNRFLFVGVRASKSAIQEMEFMTYVVVFLLLGEQHGNRVMFNLILDFVALHS